MVGRDGREIREGDTGGRDGRETWDGDTGGRYWRETREGQTGWRHRREGREGDTGVGALYVMVGDLWGNRHIAGCSKCVCSHFVVVHIWDGGIGCRWIFLHRVVQYLACCYLPEGEGKKVTRPPPVVPLFPLKTYFTRFRACVRVRVCVRACVRA